jgi:hypothetical protein
MALTVGETVEDLVVKLNFQELLCHRRLLGNLENVHFTIKPGLQ